LLIAAAVVWGWHFWPAGAPTETTLRQVARGVEVTCRISNATTRIAEQVVMCVWLNDAQGARAAANPLASVADLSAHTAKETVVIVPSSDSPRHVSAQVEVTLVRWQDSFETSKPPA
jgi:hypothetical protein